MSELQQYFTEFCQSGAWRDEDPQYCGCRGGGWFLSDLDTVHQCGIHYDGQPHPEDPEIYEEEMICGVCGGQEVDEDGQPCVCTVPAPVKAPVPAVNDDDDIPF